MRRILKWVVTPVETADEPTWLAVGAQDGQLIAWCEATPGVGHRDLLGVLTTGEPPPPGGRYIGTAQLPAVFFGEIVAHVYLIPE